MTLLKRLSMRNLCRAMYCEVARPYYVESQDYSRPCPYLSASSRMTILCLPGGRVTLV